MGSRVGGTNQERAKRESAVRDRIFKREKDVLDKTMDASIRAMEREYAEVQKKQNELVTVKSGMNYLRDTTDDLSRRSARGMASRSNLRVASNRQLQTLYSSEPIKRNASSHRSFHGTTSPKLDSRAWIKPSLKQETKAGTSGQKARSVSGKDNQLSPAKAAAVKGKGKGKGNTQQTALSVTSDKLTDSQESGKKTVSHDKKPPHVHQSQDAHPSLEHRKLLRDFHHDPIMHHRDSLSGVESSGRRGSTIRRASNSRRDSITGQTFTRDEMEEQQRILDLFIHLVEKVDDTVFDPADLTAKIKEGSTVSMHDKHHSGSPGSLHSTYTSIPAKAIPHLKRLHEDPKLMTDLQSMLDERKVSIETRHTPPSESNDENSPTNVHGRKRRVSGIEMLSDILGAYKTQYVKDVNFDPLAMLNCGYLRLSDSNVLELERLCREQGIDPGIHAHSDVTDFRLFE